MKICTAIASLLTTSVCLWADPDVAITALSYDGDRVLCQVEVTRLEDLAITEPAHAYLVVEAPTGKVWICNLGRITPQTESIGKVDYAPAEEFEAWDKVDIVLCPLEPGVDLSKMRHPKAYYDRPHHYDRLGKPYERGLGPFHDWEQRQAAQDASAQVDTRGVC